MKKAALSAAVLIASIGIFVACSLPQMGTITGTPSGSSTSSVSGNQTTDSGQSSNPIITNDPSTGIALYVRSDGSTEPVSATDPATGNAVVCTHATGFSVLATSSGTEPRQPSVLVIGERKDGQPGAWAIDRTGHVSLVRSDWGGHDGDLAPGPSDAPGQFSRLFGWSYFTTPVVSQDQKMIIGYAENTNGFHHGSISIPAGTTVSVYWRVHLGRDGHHYHVSLPRVIGTFVLPTRHHRDHHSESEHEGGRHAHFLPVLNGYTFGLLQSYLISATSVSYDATTNVYVVAGKDQNNKSAQATIASDGTVTITEVTPPATNSYSEIVVDTFDPTSPGNGFGFDVVALFSSQTIKNAGNPWQSPTTASAGTLVDASGNQAIDGESGIGDNINTTTQPYYAYIDYKPATPLPSGTVLYVRITGYSPTGSSTGADTKAGPYGIRVLTKTSSSYTYFTSVNTTDAPYEPDDAVNSTTGIPTNPAVVTLNSQGLNRYLTVGDVDWVKVVLP